jgi:hypothetical protein
VGLRLTHKTIMAIKIIGFDIEYDIILSKYFDNLKEYPTKNKEINNLNTEIWVYQGDDSPFDLETEEMYSNFLDMDEADFMKITSFTIEE